MCQERDLTHRTHYPFSYFMGEKKGGKEGFSDWLKVTQPVNDRAGIYPRQFDSKFLLSSVLLLFKAHT